MQRKWFRIMMISGVVAFMAASNAKQAMAQVQNVVQIDETMAQVYADSQYSDGTNYWPVVRLDVTNKHHDGLGVYSVIVGAKPGSYTWDVPYNNYPYTDAMLFGGTWEPVGVRNEDGTLPYLPQQYEGGWNTHLYRVQGASGSLSVDLSSNSVFGLNTFTLPDTFGGYDFVYLFETGAPFTTCSGSDCQASKPLQPKDTYSFYVTGGLGSPFLYLTENDYNDGGSWKDNYTGTGMTQHDGTNAVPEPATMLLFGSGLVGFFLRKRAA